MSEPRITQILENTTDASNTITTKSLQERAFVEGKAFTHADYTLAVGAAAVINYLFDPTAVTSDQVIAEVPRFNATAGPITIEYFVGTTVSANGTELDVFNRRASSATVPEAKLYVGPTITADGTRFSGVLLAASEAVQGDTGAITDVGLPFEVNKAALILIRITNTNGAGIGIGRRLDWVEV